MQRTRPARIGRSFSERLRRAFLTPVFTAVAILAVLTGTLSAQTAGLSPSDMSFIEEHFRAAKYFESSQKYAQAAREYEVILSKYPTAVPRVYQNLGLTY